MWHYKLGYGLGFAALKYLAIPTVQTAICVLGTALFPLGALRSGGNPLRAPMTLRKMEEKIFAGLGAHKRLQRMLIGEFMVDAHSIVVGAKGPKKGTIMMIHGVFSGPNTWRAFVPFLTSKGYEVHCVSVPGFGETMVEPLDQFRQLGTRRLLDFYGQFFEEYIEEQCSDIPILVGHSFGGYLSAKFAESRPRHCSALVLINASGLFPLGGTQSLFWAGFFRHGIPNRALRAVSGAFNVLAHCFAPKDDDPKGMWNTFSMSQKENIGDEIVSKFIHFDGRETFHHDCVFPTTKHLPPTQFIWGGDDTITPKEHALFFRDQHGINVHIVDKCWHTIAALKEEEIEIMAEKIVAAPYAPKLSRYSSSIFTEKFVATACPYRTQKEIDKMFAAAKNV